MLVMLCACGGSWAGRREQPHGVQRVCVAFHLSEDARLVLGQPHGIASLAITLSTGDRLELTIWWDRSWRLLTEASGMVAHGSLDRDGCVERLPSQLRGPFLFQAWELVDPLVSGTALWFDGKRVQLDPDRSRYFSM